MHDYMEWLQIIQVPILVYLVMIDRRLVTLETAFKYALIRKHHEENSEAE